MTRRDRVAAGLLALTLTVLLQHARGDADWGPSEGVYALSSRLLLHGGDLYGGLVASQPPWTYLFGAGVLALRDSLDALRLGSGLLQVVTALLAAEAVWRLTSARLAAIAAAGLVVVTPWATHQHGLLLPEQLGGPLLLGAALLASRASSARWAGVLAGIAVFAKLPFALPAALAIAAAPRVKVTRGRASGRLAGAKEPLGGAPGRSGGAGGPSGGATGQSGGARAVAARWAAGTLVAQAVLFTAIFGTGFWRQIVEAQVQSGGTFELQAGAWVQATWNLLPLLAFAAVAVALRRAAADAALMRTLAATAAGALAMTATIVKPGTGLNVVVPSEPLLATLAVAGVVFALRAGAEVGADGERPPRSSRTILAAAALGLLLLAQSASLLLDPLNPRPFHRPLSSSPGWKVGHDRAEVDRLVVAAKACPPGSVYAGPPLVAFIAQRRVPAGQPDAFIVSHASMHAGVLKRYLADGPRCP